MKRRLALTLESILSLVSQRARRGDSSGSGRLIPDSSGPGELPGHFLGKAVTFGRQRPLTRYYSVVRESGGGLTLWVYCPEVDSRAHEDESVSHVDELVEYCENRGLDSAGVYHGLKSLEHPWARQFKRRSFQRRWV